MTGLILAGWAASAAIATATLVHIYRGGTTANDHAVALVATGTHGVFPVLWWGAVAHGVAPLRPVGLGLLAGAVGVWSLFWLMDRRQEAGPWMLLAGGSQLAHAFALWTGMLMVAWMPLVGLLRWAGWTDLHPLWPGWLLTVPAVLAVVGCAHTARHRLRVLRWRVPVRGLPAPIRLVQLSDLHASPTMTGRHLQDIVWVVQQEDPDLVAITGDHVMPFSEQEHGWLLHMLRTLPRPAVACPGNHDLPVEALLQEEFTRLGVPWLADETQVVSARGVQVEVTGVQFHWKQARERLQAALEGLTPPPGAHLRVLLAHDPRLSAWVPDGRFDLVLCGHTHGGQIGGEVFGLRPSMLSLLGVRDQGWFLDGDRRTYVHRGNWHVGWPPRMGIAPEIAVFEMVPATDGEPLTPTVLPR